MNVTTFDDGLYIINSKNNSRYSNDVSYRVCFSSMKMLRYSEHNNSVVLSDDSAGNYLQLDNVSNIERVDDVYTIFKLSFCDKSLDPVIILKTIK